MIQALAGPDVEVEVQSAKAAPRVRRSWAAPMRSPLAIGLASVAVAVALWALLSLSFSTIQLPSPAETVTAGWRLVTQGSLWQDALASLTRVAEGFFLGCAVGVPIGLLTGQFLMARTFLEPYLDMARFVTPIALLPIVVILFGTGEMSKVFLIFYSVVFIMVLNTMIGVRKMPLIMRRSAQSMGANEKQIFFRVTIPQTVPYVITGMRMAMGNAFMTVVAAELLYSEHGIGHLIASSRLYFRTPDIFVGILVLGAIGFTADRLLRFIAKHWASKYGVKI